MAHGVDLDQHTKTTIKSDSRTSLKKPNLFRVIIYNDDYTSMEFVVMVLMKVFNKPESALTVKQANFL